MFSQYLKNNIIGNIQLIFRDHVTIIFSAFLERKTNLQSHRLQMNK